MRSGALACVLSCLALAACYEDAPGARLVIKDPGFGAHEVELFIATRDASADNVAPDQSRENEVRGKLRGDHAYFLDGPADRPTPMTKLPIVGGQVVWNLTVDPEGTPKAKLVVAVAYDRQGTAVAIARMEHLEIPTNDSVAYVLQLEAAMQIAPSDTMNPAGIRVWPWRKEGSPDTAACLALEHSDGANNLQRIWLVPEDDPDCDEVQVECDEYFWHANDTNINGGLDDANCFSGTAMPRPGDPTNEILTQCYLGARPCIDGTAPGTCVALTQPKYCVANALCNPAECTNRPDQCMNAIASSYTACTHPVDALGQVCTSGGGGGPVIIDLFPVVTVCSEVKFTAWDVLGSGVNPTDAYVANGAMFTLGAIEPGKCKFQLVMDGPITLTGQRMTLLFALDVTLPMGDHLLLPLILTVVGNCDENPGCQVSPTLTNDSAGACH